MARTPKAKLTPEVLVWGRTRRKLSIEEAAERIKKPVETLLAWETGEEQPTIAQLRAVAKAYGFPLATFFLPEPPLRFDPMKFPPDFRSKTAADPQALRAAILEAWRARLAAVQVAKELGEVPDLFPLLGAASLSANLALKVRGALGVSLEVQKTWRQPRLGYNAWRAKLEDVGFVVVQFGAVDPADARAFSIYAEPFPVIAVNSNDSYAGRSFSLFHELGHLLRRSGGLCDETENRKEEIACNAFAADVLVPKEFLRAHEAVRSHDSPNWPPEVLSKLRLDFAVSEEVVLRRLLDLGLTTSDFYAKKRAEYLAAIQEKSEKKSSGGPSVPIRTVARLGPGYVRRVLTALQEGRITTSEASGILQAKVKHFPKLEQRAFA